MLNPNYVTKKMDYIDKEGYITPNVCNLIYVKSIIKMIDAADVDMQVILETVSNGQTIEMQMDYSTLIQSQESLLKELSRLGYLMNFKFANPMREYLYFSAQSAQNNNNYTQYHSTLGFLDCSPNPPAFLLGNTVFNGISSTYLDAKMKFTTGQSTDYQKFLDDYILPYDTMRYALILGLSSVAASYLKDYADVGTVLLNLSGPSSTGKTTTAQFIASLWGQPQISNLGLVRTFNATQNALIHSLRGISGVPVCLDDATTGGFKNRTELIYSLAQSEPKLRLTSKIQFRDSGKTWSGMIIITSEQPIVDDAENRPGILARVLDTNGLVFTQSAEHAEAIKRFISSNYGHIGRKYARKLLTKTEDEIKSMFDECKVEVLEKLITRDGLSSRIANKIAIIRMTAKLVKEFWDYSSIDVDEITEFMVKVDQDNVEERHVGEKALEVIKNYIQMYHSHYKKLDMYFNELIPEKGALYGYIRYFKTKDEDNDKGKKKKSEKPKEHFKVDIVMPIEIVDKVLRAHRIYDKNVVLKYWGDAGLIHQQSGRNTIKDSKFKTRVVKFEFEKDKETMIPWYASRDIPLNVRNEPSYSESAEYDDLDNIEEIFKDLD